MLSIPPEDFSDIVEDAEISKRRKTTFKKMIEDLRELQATTKRRGNTPPFPINRGPKYEFYSANLPLHSLPEIVCHKNQEYKFRTITEEYLNEIKSLED